MKVCLEFSGPEKRLDLFLGENLELSRSKIKSLIKAGHCQVNTKVIVKPSLLLKPGDRVELEVPEEENSLQAKPGQLQIIDQQEDFLVLNKPAGISVHPAPSEKGDTLVHFLLHHFPELKKIQGERPGIVHRLDKDTSGLLLVALREETRVKLSSLFAQRLVDKKYVALVKGCPSPEKGEIDLPLGRDPRSKIKQAVLSKGGREARTSYEVLWTNGDYSVLKVKIFTGRTHQIRVHLSHLGHPILGDELYGGQIAPSSRQEQILNKLVKRQLLHAFYLRFPWQNSWQEYEADLPLDFKQALLFLLKESLKVVLLGLPGSGKSLVARELSPYVFEADKEVEKLYQPQADGYFLLTRILGPDILTADKKIDKEKLFKYLQNPSLRREIEKSIHPLVLARWKNFQKTQATKPIIVGDIPLYLETGLKEKDVLLVGIKRNPEERWQALKKRGWSEEKIETLDSFQLPEEKKLKEAHFILNNSGNLEELRTKVRALKGILLDLKRKRLRKKFSTLRSLLKEAR